jgi:hypothetical protein
VQPTFIGIFGRDLLSSGYSFDYYFVHRAGRKGRLDKGEMRPRAQAIENKSSNSVHFIVKRVPS